MVATRYLSSGPLPKTLRLLALAGALLAALESPARAEEVNLGTNVSDFEQFYNRGGGSIKHIQCIFSKLGYAPEINRMPWRRARREVATDRIDGFFTAIESMEVDKYATLSAPLLLENWYWYWPADIQAPDVWRNGIRLGAILGSHQAVWLDQNDYPVHLRVGSLPQLVKLMLSGRIDAFVADREHMEATLEALGIGPERYQQRFLRYVPLGVYFGNDFLADHPAFLSRFNEQVFPCAPSGFVMSAREQEEIHALLQRPLENWVTKHKVPSVLAEYNQRRQALSAEDRVERDRVWREAFEAGSDGAVLPLIDEELSDQLRVLDVDTDGLLTELILTDARGMNVAISNMTSDYWQGDESKFTGALELRPGQLHFEPVSYDESTRLFQVHISRPVFAPDSGEPIGVLIVGVNIEKALSLRH